MLGRLLKYDLKYYCNYFLLIHVVLLAAALGGRLSMSGLFAQLRGYAGIGVMAFFFVFTYILAILAVNVIGIVLIVRRFYQNLFGSEGYLSFTLPVTAGEHFASKVISAVLWVVASALIQALSMVILCSGVVKADMFAGFSDALGQMFSQLMSGRNMILQAAIGVFDGLAGLLMIYFAICLGQLVNRHRVISSVVIYLGLNYLCKLIGSFFTNTFIHFHPYGGRLISFGTGYYGVTILLLILKLVIFSAGSVWIMQKKLNLE